MDDNGDLIHHIVSDGSLGRGESRDAGYVGTKALMLAIFEEAIRTYFGPRGRLCREAEHWINSHKVSAFSFTTVCETLGLDPDAVRQQLPRLKADLVRPLSRIKNSRMTESRKLTRV